MIYTIPAPPPSQLEQAQQRAEQLAVELAAEQARTKLWQDRCRRAERGYVHWRNRASLWFGVFWALVAVIAGAQIYRALYGAGN